MKNIHHKIVILILIEVVVSSCLWKLVLISQSCDFFPHLVERRSNYGFDVLLVSGVLIAPIVEEFIFRYPIIFFKKPLFFIVVSSIIFGIIHIRNYDYQDSHLPYIILITSPQIFAGFVFAYVRTKFGFGYCVVTHATSNFILILYEHYVGW